jgi:hypothetical protein
VLGLFKHESVASVISSSLLQALLMLSRVKSMLSCMKSDICFWKWGFDKVFWNFISAYNLMLNSGKQFCALRDKKIDILTRVVRKKNSERNKKT